MPERTTVVKRRRARAGTKAAAAPAAVKVTCGYCQGTGKDRFGVMSRLSACQVCKGRGEVRVRPPTATCRYCNGTGVEPYSANRLTCSACGGKGLVTAVKNGVPCPACRGSGIHPLGRTMAFACAKCKGQGVVPSLGRVRKTRTKSATTAGRPRATKAAPKGRGKPARARK